MGSEFVLFKPEKNEWFDLGKGYYWYDVFDSDNDFYFIGNTDYLNAIETIQKYSEFINKDIVDLVDKILEWSDEDVIQFHPWQQFAETYEIIPTNNTTNLKETGSRYSV